MGRLATWLALVAAGACGAPDAAPEPPPERARLRAIFAEEWEMRVAADPLFATYAGRPEGRDRLPSATPEALARRAEQDRRLLARVAALDRDALSEGDRVDLAVFERIVANRLAEHDFGAHEIPWNADSGFHTAFAALPRDLDLRAPRDWEDYAARLRDWPRWVDEEVALMRAGIARGNTLPRAVLAGFDEALAVHVVDDPEASAFFEPFERLPAGLPPHERERLRELGRAAVRDGVVPGYARLLRFFREEYRPGARDTLGASELPRGRDRYAHLVRAYTTLEVTPEEVHRIGLDEVARIRSEMEAVVAETGFDGDFAAFLEHLRTDPRFYAESAEELLREAAWRAKRADAMLPRYFTRMPRRPYGVAPVPADIAPKYTAGRYVRGDGTGPGWYWVNTYALESRPLYALTALTLHEAVPGHHFQISLAREMEDVPEFRRHDYLPVFGEGWALYCEWLGVEAGQYDGPYDHFGRLTYEMWRACRLVVDTGVHAFGWSRGRAIEYLASNTALSLHECTTEVDRYISWPGQALSYKIGEIRIRALRAEAEAELGERFDLRAFHDALLAHGSVPLDVLDGIVARYVAARR